MLQTFNIVPCDFGDLARPITVTVDISNPVNIGDVYFLSLGSGSRCVTVVDTPIRESISATYVAGPYTDCIDCYLSNPENIYLLFRNCQTDNSIIIPITDFVSQPTIDDIYFLEYYTIGFGDYPIINDLIGQGCFVFNQYIYYNFSADGPQIAAQYSNLISISNSYGSSNFDANCATCLGENSKNYNITGCDGRSDIITLTDLSLINHIISYSIGSDIYCGIVKDETTSEANATLVADYGLFNNDEQCQECISASQKKIEIQNCLTNEVSVVWSSPLLDSGDASNLSYQDGCYTILGETTNDVTLIGYLDFEPYPDCQDCNQCYGLTYKWTSCESDATGTSLIYQDMVSGQTFYNPLLDECVTITSVSTNSGYYNPDFYSVFDYSSGETSCSDCQTPTYESWIATFCNTTASGYYDNTLLVTVESTLGVGVGDVVSLQWGDSPSICAELTEPFNPLLSVTPSVKGIATSKFIDCAECESNSLVGLSVKNCATNEEKFVNITKSNYLTLIQFYLFGNGLPYTTMSDSNGNCWRFNAVCPITPEISYELLTPTNFYINCAICDFYTDEPSRSANTEYTVCVICCDCGSTGSTITQVSPPHPVWTDGYGVSVTQLNMITLGGNGLNS